MDLLPSALALAVFVTLGQTLGDGSSRAVEGLRIVQAAEARHPGFASDVEKYVYLYRREARLDGVDCWVVERIPRDRRAARQTIWIGKRGYRPLQIRYGDEARTYVKGE